MAKSTNSPPMATQLARPFPRALSALFGSLDGACRAGLPVFAGTPGNIALRRNQNGAEYYVRRYYIGGSVQKEEYLGVKEAAIEKVKELQQQINEVKEVRDELRLLVREGLQAADRTAYVKLAALSMSGLFAADATLIGRHAYGVILNQLGFRAEKEVAGQGEVLAFNGGLSKARREILRDNAGQFENALTLGSNGRHGRTRTPKFVMSLAVPSATSKIHHTFIAGLNGDAVALPYLAYLLDGSSMSMLLAREGCCPVRVPRPERFAMHKLLVAQLRVREALKSRADIVQASVVIDALGQGFLGALEKAFDDLPKPARNHVVKAVPMVLRYLGRESPAAEELCQAVTRSARSAPRRRYRYAGEEIQ